MAFAALLRADAAFLWQRRELLGQGLLSLAVSKRVPRWQALARLGGADTSAFSFPGGTAESFHALRWRWRRARECRCVRDSAGAIPAADTAQLPILPHLFDETARGLNAIHGLGDECGGQRQTVFCRTPHPRLPGTCRPSGSRDRPLETRHVINAVVNGNAALAGNTDIFIGAGRLAWNP